MRAAWLCATLLTFAACGDDEGAKAKDTIDTADTADTTPGDSSDATDSDDLGDVEEDGEVEDVDTTPPSSSSCLPRPEALTQPTAGLPCELIPPGLVL